MTKETIKEFLQTLRKDELIFLMEKSYCLSIFDKDYIDQAKSYLELYNMQKEYDKIKTQSDKLNAAWDAATKAINKFLTVVGMKHGEKIEVLGDLTPAEYDEYVKLKTTEITAIEAVQKQWDKEKEFEKKIGLNTKK